MAKPSSISRLHDLHPAVPDIAADVIAGLSATPRSLPSKYFYDARGSRLFERICETPEYYLTRAELDILRRHANAIAAFLGERIRLVEYGAGAGEKTELLLRALHDPVAYLPVEISRSALLDSAAQLSRSFPALELIPVCADFTQRIDLPATRRRARRSVVYLAGSTIGNFLEHEAIELLRNMRDTAGSRGAVLLGYDRKKDPTLINAAYNDAEGITAAFTLNLLQRLNRELDGDFDLQGFAHHAVYSASAGRVETDIVSRSAQQVRVAGRRFALQQGERIRVEVSCKYDDDDIARIARAASLELGPCWSDADGHFGLQVLLVSGRPVNLSAVGSARAGQDCIASVPDV
jgi:dimethylhistidine N-methyltransferase